MALELASRKQGADSYSDGRRTRHGPRRHRSACRGPSARNARPSRSTAALADLPTATRIAALDQGSPYASLGSSRAEGGPAGWMTRISPGTTRRQPPTYIPAPRPAGSPRQTQVAEAGRAGSGPPAGDPPERCSPPQTCCPSAGQALLPGGADCQSVGWIRTRTARCKRRAGGAADPTPLRPRPVTAPRLGWTHQLLGLDPDDAGPPAQLHGNPLISLRPPSGPPGLPESPCRVGQDGGPTPVPTNRPRRPALRAARAAGLKFAGPTAAAPDPAGSPNSGKSIRPPLSQGARLSSRASESRSSAPLRLKCPGPTNHRESRT